MAKAKEEVVWMDDDHNVVAKDEATLVVIRKFTEKGDFEEIWATVGEKAEGEKRGALVEPKGKPLRPFTKDEVPISDEDIDAAIATWNERMPKRAKGVLEARVPTAEEEVEAEQDLEAEGGA